MARRSGHCSADPVDAIAWLTEPLPGFGSKLGGVLFRLDERTVRDDDRLDGLLRAWPPSIPLVVEAQHPSWHVDETFAALRDAGAVLCATDLDDLEEPPTIRRTGPFLYLRLRRSDVRGRGAGRLGGARRAVRHRWAGRVRRVPA